MSDGGQQPSLFYNFSYMQNTISNTTKDTSSRSDASRAPLPTIQPSTPNKGAPSQTVNPIQPSFFLLSAGNTQANVTASSGSSTTESLSELTSHSSRDSLPAAVARRGDTTPRGPQGRARNYRRNKSSKSNAKWSREGGSPDDTSSERKPPTSQPSNESSSPLPIQKQRHPHSSTHSPAVVQGRLMATTFGSPSGDSRRGVVSPRPKGRGMRPPIAGHDATSLIRPSRN